MRVPIGVALGVVAFTGFWYLRNVTVALSVLEDSPFVFAANWDLTAIPMFLLMGSVANNSGISAALFRAARVWFGALPGGLAVATNLACAGFAAACGSSVAAAAAMARLAIPEMLKHGYEKGLAAGVGRERRHARRADPAQHPVRALRHLRRGLDRQAADRGHPAGLLTAAIYAIMIIIRCKLDPSLAPLIEFPDRKELWRERWESMRGIWPLLLIILGIIGGMFAGVVTPTEAGAGGAFLAVIIGFAQRTLTFQKFLDSLRDAIATSAQLFFVGIGAVMYTKFLALAGIGPMFTDMIGGWAINPLLLVIAITIIYLILGMFLDPLGIVLITVPVFVPMFAALNLDLVWLGVLVVKYVEIGMLTPPVGFNVYVVKSVVGDTIPLQDDLPRLLLVPRLRGRDHDVADRVSADLALAADLMK